MHRLLDAHGSRDGRGGRSACALLARAYDEIVIALWHTALAVEGSAGEALALVATRGWGREEVCPFSDIDFILLAPPMATDAARRVADRLLYPLWDASRRRPSSKPT